MQAVRYCKILIVLSALYVIPAMAQTSDQNSQKPSAAPCAAAPFREFDFWVGEWEVRDPEGKVVGVNVITSEENGCAIVERWKSSNGSGQSLNHYDPAAKRWRQHWVGLGLVLEMEGGVTDGAMIMEGPLQYLVEGRSTRLKGTWTRLPDGRVRQLFEESDDGGKTWKLWFDGHYTRRLSNL